MLWNAFQRLAAIVMLIILLPLMLVIALIIACGSKGPVFFRQRRIGRHGAEFRIFKFRTMRTDTPADVPTHLMDGGASEAYITREGGFLRRSSLDELPQLLNVIKGDMLFVGPRPALYNQYDLIGMRRERGVDALYPGITGLAQVNGRDELTIAEKVAFDAEYLEKRSFMFDMKILFKTIGRVLRGSGVRQGRGE